MTGDFIGYSRFYPVLVDTPFGLVLARFLEILLLSRASVGEPIGRRPHGVLLSFGSLSRRSKVDNVPHNQFDEPE
jgi:hypothetical protein